MKKTRLNPRLKLTVQTVRTLTPVELGLVAGGGPTGSTHTGCGNRPTLTKGEGGEP